MKRRKFNFFMKIVTIVRTEDMTFNEKYIDSVDRFSKNE